MVLLFYSSFFNKIENTSAFENAKSELVKLNKQYLIEAEYIVAKQSVERNINCCQQMKIKWFDFCYGEMSFKGPSGEVNEVTLITLEVRNTRARAQTYRHTHSHKYFRP